MTRKYYNLSMKKHRKAACTVQVLLMVNTLLLETCRRQYASNRKKFLMKIVCILLALIIYIYHDARLRKRKVRIFYLFMYI
jgi:hypothetical protein